MKQNKEKAAETLDELLETALAPKTDAVKRRGAAMGVGATVKGIGIQAVRQHNILKTIEAAAEDTDLSIKRYQKLKITSKQRGHMRS